MTDRDEGSRTAILRNLGIYTDKQHLEYLPMVVESSNFLVKSRSRSFIPGRTRRYDKARKDSHPRRAGIIKGRIKSQRERHAEIWLQDLFPRTI